MAKKNKTGKPEKESPQGLPELTPEMIPPELAKVMPKITPEMQEKMKQIKAKLDNFTKQNSHKSLRQRQT